jgi:SAM-dependent methyltransferase
MTAHLGGAYASGDANTIMPDVWGYLLTKYPIRRVLDVGCGYGQAMRWFADVGDCDVIGLDGDTTCAASDPNHIRVHDFSAGPWASTSEDFDLAWSAEFLEHVDEKFLPNIMSAFARARLVVVTHAEPGQPGHHHVNCRPTNYWIERFAEHGFEHLPNETALLRATDRKHATYGRRTLTVFQRRGTVWNPDRPTPGEPGLVGVMRQMNHPLLAGASVRGPYQDQLHALVKVERPYVVVETGVMSGISTNAILAALDLNDRGILYSIEPDPCGGIMDIAHSRWQQCRAFSHDVLGPIFKQTGPWDIFLHDSDHEVACQTFEYECAWHFVRPGGLILSDDTCWGLTGSSTAPAHLAWETFCQRYGLIEFEVGFARGVRKPLGSESCLPAYGEDTERDAAIAAAVARAKVRAATALTDYKKRLK